MTILKGRIMFVPEKFLKIAEKYADELIVRYLRWIYVKAFQVEMLISI